MISAAALLSFRSHVRPAQLTRCVRHRLTRDLWTQQRLWMGLTLVYGVIAAMSVMLIGSWNQLGDMQSEVVRSVMLGTAFFLVLLEIYFFRRRRFVLNMPVTTAVVVRRKEAPHYSDSSSAGAPQLLVRFAPTEEDLPESSTVHAEDSRTVWVTLNGYSSSFEQKVCAGDFVSILYDPHNPEHVEVVELDTLA